MTRISDQMEIVDSKGRHHVPDPEILQLAEEILEQFVELRRYYVAGTCRVNKKHYHKFYEAAQLCRLRKQTAAEYVTRQLKGMARKGCFWPSAIASEQLADLGEDHKICEYRLARYYKSQLICFTNWAKIYGSRQALLDNTLQLTPLFRLAVAHRLGFSDLVRDIARESKLDAQNELNSSEAAHFLFAEEMETIDV